MDAFKNLDLANNVIYYHHGIGKPFLFTKSEAERIESLVSSLSGLDKLPSDILFTGNFLEYDEESGTYFKKKDTIEMQFPVFAILLLNIFLTMKWFYSLITI